ncbi:MAG TPA: DUF1593 domain-containing protein [Firmicutes bacterium]|nr:DUF1593 domain-containing protein [Bacillota bacterium]
MTTSRKPRLVVLTDIGGDPDDQQSLIRLLTYANEFTIEGIIPELWSGNEHARRGIDAESQMQLVREIISAYGEVQANLARHAAGYPDAGYLNSCLKRGMVNVPTSLEGDPGPAEKVIGEGKDTEGSDWIIAVVDREDPRPVNVAVWGGPADLAQALWRVRRDRSQAELERFLAKIRVHTIGDQDATGPWIRRHFPALFYILNMSRSGKKLSSCYRGMYLGGDETLTSAEWVKENIAQEHGPLGRLYPLQTWTAPNPHGCLKEGDTPSWFYFLENGLNVPGRPDWGGWGGRFTKNGSFFQDALDTEAGETSHRATVFRWRAAFQNDFAARMDWCVKPATVANHPPLAALVGAPPTRAPHFIAAHPGETLTLDASASTDPDGDSLCFSWWMYQEAGTYTGPVELHEADTPVCRLPVPEDAGGHQLHIILEVQDDGEPPLTTYRRVVVEISA